MDPKSGMIRFLGRFFPGRLSKTTWVSPKSWWYMMLPRTGNLHLENDDRPWKFGCTLFSNQPLFKVVLILNMVSLSYFNHGFPLNVVLMSTLRGFVKQHGRESATRGRCPNGGADGVFANGRAEFAGPGIHWVPSWKNHGKIPSKINMK